MSTRVHVTTAGNVGIIPLTAGEFESQLVDTRLLDRSAYASASFTAALVIEDAGNCEAVVIFTKNPNGLADRLESAAKMLRTKEEDDADAAPDAG